MSTERTSEEAEDYIIDSIDYWKKNGQKNRIVSLGNWAENYRNIDKRAATGKQIKVLNKNINALNRIIRRNTSNDLPNSEELQTELAKNQVCLDKLIEDFTPVIRKGKAAKPTK